MKERLRKRIKELTSLIGVSGHEWFVAEYIYHALKDSVDSIEVRPNGAVIAIKKGKLPGGRRMITAHMDEVGYIVKSVSPAGFLFFGKAGSPTEACLPGRRVLVRGTKGTVEGVIGTRAGHLLTAEQKAKPQTVGQSYVDIFVKSAEEAAELGIGPGAQIVPFSPCEEMNGTDYMVTRAADCRVLCAIIIETMLDLDPEKTHGEVCAVFNVLEESTVAACAAAVNYLKPIYGMFLDTIPCGDVPDCDFAKELPVALDRGPVIVLEQYLTGEHNYVVSNPKLVDAVRNISKEMQIPHQEVMMISARYITDAVTSSYAGDGMATITFACPRRYSHSPTEVFHLEDTVRMQKIVEQFIMSDININMF